MSSRTLTTNNTSVGFENNDFWYKNPIIKDNMPTYEECSLMKQQGWDVACNDTIKNDSDRSSCIKYELCVNRYLSEKLIKLQTQHRGSDQDYLDTKEKYTQQYIEFFNLGIGVLGVILITYTLMKNRQS